MGIRNRRGRGGFARGGLVRHCGGMRVFFMLAAMACCGVSCSSPPRWPEASGSVVVGETIRVPAGEDWDFGYLRLVPAPVLGDGSQREDQQPVIRLEEGASVRRVIVGAPGVDGIHCAGRNRLRNVWFEDVGEDAVTVRGPDVRWLGGGARNAEDKIVQMNHAGPFVGQRLVWDRFATGVRGNGNPPFRETPFRIRLREVWANDGRAVVRLSSAGARARLVDVRAVRVGELARVSGGSRANLSRVSGNHRSPAFRMR